MCHRKVSTARRDRIFSMLFLVPDLTFSIKIKFKQTPLQKDREGSPGCGRVPVCMGGEGCTRTLMSGSGIRTLWKKTPVYKGGEGQSYIRM